MGGAEAPLLSIRHRSLDSSSRHRPSRALSLGVGSARGSAPPRSAREALESGGMPSRTFWNV